MAVAFIASLCPTCYILVIRKMGAFSAVHMSDYNREFEEL
jgi:hypothetical protein